MTETLTAFEGGSLTWRRVRRPLAPHFVSIGEGTRMMTSSQDVPLTAGQLSRSMRPGWLPRS